MEESSVETSVIGSYPVKIDNLSLMKKFYNQKEISWKRYIDQAVGDMVDSGVEVISDGQTRDSFITIFTRNIGGFRIRDRDEIIDEISYKEPITVDDIIYINKIIPNDRKALGLITGAYTIAKSSLDSYYEDEKTLVFDLADVLHKEAKSLEEHVDLISIDEPFFSNNFPEYGVELVKKIVKDIDIPCRLHVCGDVSEIIPNLLSIPVDILSHEFKASPHLFDVFKEYCDGMSQGICMGCVRSDDSHLEQIDEIVSHIQTGIDIFGDNICQISPDCGLKNLSKETAFQKLVNLVEAGEICYGR
ncbi:MAG: hypothetical protein V5A68_03815 [Candidatus Thermoplasmatota archaeon]